MSRYKEQNIFSIFSVFDMCCSNFLFFSISKGNFCITQIGTDGTYRGYAPGFGTANQPSTLKPIFYDCSFLFDCSLPLKCNEYDIFIHTLMWDSSGHFILKLGEFGNEKYENNNTLLVDGRIATWNDTEKYYEFTDEEFADELIPLTEKCFYITTP